MRDTTALCFGKKLVLMAALVPLATIQGAYADIRLPAVVGDNMVLQRDTEVPLWGRADPGEKVELRASWDNSERSAIADAKGAWKAAVTTPSAGGPYEIALTGKNRITLQNILVGEVWVCSGQSNMEWPLRESNHAKHEIDAADYPDIRLFTVKKKIATEPQSDCIGKWISCSPQAIADFSAVAYFFGRHLYQELDVPVGLIHTSWGGTLAEAWTSRDALENMGGFQAEIDRFAEVFAHPESVAQAYRKAATERRKMLRAAARQSREALQPNVDLSDWMTMELPAHWENAGLPGFDGMVWFCRTVEIPAAWTGEKLTLELGPIDDHDTTWVNGVEVGAHTGGEHWKTPRIYEIDASLVHPGKNALVVQVLDTGREGGLWGKPEQMKLARSNAPDQESIPLAGLWRYKAGVSIPPEPTNWMEYPNFPTALYNGMIAPIIPFGIRGAIWYQGESNAGRAYQYRELLPLMISDWRDRWGQGEFPFLFVQLANFMEIQPEPTESVWAELREAQRMTLNHPNTGMATIIDIGEADDIHPRNKEDVGKRLALWALGTTYGQHRVYSGPLYKSMAVKDDAIVLQFEHLGGGLVAKGDKLKGFAVAGADRRFVWADARIEGDTVVVGSGKVDAPVAVRYAWADNPVCNLYNQAGLPASPFRTDDWPHAILPKERADHYMTCVRSCLDNLLEHGTDRYGPVHTPMLMSIMDVRTNTSPQEPEVLDGLIRSEGRLHRRNPRGGDLWDDQPLLRTLYTVSELVEEPRYAQAAEAYIKVYFERAKKQNGLLAWGSHIYYDAYKDAPAGDQDGAGPHEILVLCPNWDRMWRVDPVGVRGEIERIWEWHVVDKETGLHNRHDDKHPGCDFAFSGGEFGYAFAFLHAQTKDPKYLEWSKTVFGRHWHARNADTNLAPDAPGTGDRYDAHHCFTTLPGPHAALLLKAFELTGDPWLKDVALAHIKAYLKYGWDAEAQQYHGMLALDGTPIPVQPKNDANYDVWKPTGHVDIWRAIMFSYEFPVLAAQTAVYAYDLTGDADALQAARNWATNIRAQMPPSNGRRWAKEIDEALPEAKAKGGTYAENYGRAISFFLHLYRATSDVQDLETAVALAEEAIDKLYENGWFKGHPAKPYYESTDGVAYLLYALLELAAHPKDLPANL